MQQLGKAQVIGFSLAKPPTAELRANRLS